MAVLSPKNLRGGAQPHARACGCASSGVHRADSWIFQMESNDGSWDFVPRSWSKM